MFIKNCRQQHFIICFKCLIGKRICEHNIIPIWRTIRNTLMKRKKITSTPLFKEVWIIPDFSYKAVFLFSTFFSVFSFNSLSNKPSKQLLFLYTLWTNFSICPRNRNLCLKCNQMLTKMYKVKMFFTKVWTKKFLNRYQQFLKSVSFNRMIQVSYCKFNENIKFQCNICFL